MIGAEFLVGTPSQASGSDASNTQTPPQRGQAHGVGWAPAASLQSAHDSPARPNTDCGIAARASADPQRGQRGGRGHEGPCGSGIGRGTLRVFIGARKTGAGSEPDVLPVGRAVASA